MAYMDLASERKRFCRSGRFAEKNQTKVTKLQYSTVLPLQCLNERVAKVTNVQGCGFEYLFSPVGCRVNRGQCPCLSSFSGGVTADDGLCVRRGTSSRYTSEDVQSDAKFWAERQCPNLP